MPKIPKVDVNRSRRSRSFSSPERLWQDDLDRLIEMIQEHVKNLEYHIKDKKSDLDSAPNLSLAVFGPAGSGKSSFLKTLVEETRKKPDGKLKRVASLDILQPARFGERDHLLYATIAAGLNAHRKEDIEDLDYEVLTGVLKAYRELSGDLRVLCEEPSVADLEPQALAAEVIQRHTSGLSLGKKVDAFLAKLADDLNSGLQDRDRKSSVVLLPVDDLDLSPRHLLSGLRELQAYLLHPRLVPVFCFTDRLAEEILAGEFAKMVTHADQSRKLSGRLSVSEQLAVQYLSKCFPVRNRLRLGPIPATLQGGNLERRGRRPEEEPEEEPVLWTLITASVLLFGVPDRSARHPVRSALRPTTLRRQFHVIDVMQQVGIDSLINRRVISLLKPGIGSMKAGDHERVPAETWGVLFDRAAWALMNVHRDVLREYGMYLEDLYGWAPRGLRRILLDSLFQQPGKVQAGLWQRWRSLTDSRRSQVISLLAANAYRPWLDGERASGEDLPQIAIARAEKGHAAARWCECEDECLRKREGEIKRRCKAKHQVLDAPVALQWFLDLAVGFYLPLGRSVYRYLRAGKPGAKEPLIGGGWSFHTAPIHAAHAAHDDQKLFPTGMMFLDPFSYATALTTAPRIAACQVLDEALVTDDQWPFVKNAKVFFLSAETKALVTLTPEIEGLWKKLLKEAKENKLDQALEDAKGIFQRTADWESGKKKGIALRARYTDLYKHLQNLKSSPEPIQIAARDLEYALLKHDYDKALLLIARVQPEEKGEDFRRHIRGLEAAATAVHDDQLLLRIWTCYGYNRGRFWAAVSLWRGLGLMGHLIESHRRWQVEYLTVGTNGERMARISTEARKKLPKSSDYKNWIVEKITGELHTHSLRGLVPGKDLGEPAHKGTLELAFSGWNTKGQRKAIRRLAKRLQSWLDHNWGLQLSPAQKGQDPHWGGCFVRRLHGGYFVGSLWQWLDAEFLEHQGKQYGQRRSYYWNAGVALTSWIRVLQRYFGRLHEMRWLLETCPIAGPFLSRSPTDPFLGKLREKPYMRMLWSVAQDGEQMAQVESSERRKMRIASRFRAITQQLQKLWDRGANLERIKELCGTSSEEKVQAAIDTLKMDAKTPRTRETWNLLADQILRRLMQDPTPDWRKFFAMDSDDLDRVVNVAKKAREEVKDGDDTFNDHYRESLLATFRPRVVRPNPPGEIDGQRPSVGEGDEDQDLIDSTSACFEIASMIQQHWKVTAHASAASLFYQTPRVRRIDFFDQKETDSLNVKVSGKLEIDKKPQ